MKFELTVLGSASALPTSLRFPTAQVLQVHERFFLIDCGEGTQLQLRKHKIGFSRINQIFISHLHGDHIFGLFGLLSTFQLLGRKHPLDIFGPEGLEEITAFFMLHFNDNPSYDIHIHNIRNTEPKVVFEDKKVMVKAFKLRHRVPCFGYVFYEKEREPNIKKEAIRDYNLGVKDILGLKRKKDYISPSGERIPYAEMTIKAPKPRSYAFCTDTSSFPKLAEYIADVDLLYHEATFSEQDSSLAKTTGHSTAKEAAANALRANVRKLLLGHFSARYKNLQILLNEARQTFVNTELVEDGHVYSIPLENHSES